MITVNIYTDGACKGNPGPGGWGALLQVNKAEREIFGGELNTTNNKMELTAVINAIKALTKPCHVLLHVDSKYVYDGIRSWLPKWKANDWKTSTKQAVKNIELWQEIDTLMIKHKVELIWVKAHNGHNGNERADKLANKGVQSLYKDYKFDSE